MLDFIPTSTPTNLPSCFVPCKRERRCLLLDLRKKSMQSINKNNLLPRFNDDCLFSDQLKRKKRPIFFRHFAHSTKIKLLTFTQSLAQLYPGLIVLWLWLWHNQRQIMTMSTKFMLSLFHIRLNILQNCYVFLFSSRIWFVGRATKRRINTQHFQYLTSNYTWNTCILQRGDEFFAKKKNTIATIFQINILDINFTETLHKQKIKLQRYWIYGLDTIKPTTNNSS